MTHINPIPKKNNLRELDYMRVIACIAVVLVHITTIGVTDYPKGSIANIIMIIFNKSLLFVTPLFIFISGVTSFYGKDFNNFNYFAFLKRKLYKILIPYFFWCVIYYISNIARGLYPFDVVYFIKAVIAGGLSYHFYFIVIIVQLYILAPVFYRVINTKHPVLVLLIFAVLTEISVEFIRHKYMDRLFPRYMLYYALGIYASANYEAYSSWLKKHFRPLFLFWIVLTLAYSLSYIYFPIYNSMIWVAFSTASILFMNSALLSLHESTGIAGGFIGLVGQSSYYIYLIHPLILGLLKYITPGITSVTVNLIIRVLVVLPVSVILSISYTRVKNKYYKA